MQYIDGKYAFYFENRSIRRVQFLIELRFFFVYSFFLFCFHECLNDICRDVLSILVALFVHFRCTIISDFLLKLFMYCVILFDEFLYSILEGDRTRIFLCILLRAS